MHLGLGFVGKIGFEYSAKEVFEYSNNIRISVGRKRDQFFSDLHLTFYI